MTALPYNVFYGPGSQMEYIEKLVANKSDGQITTAQCHLSKDTM